MIIIKKLTILFLVSSSRLRRLSSCSAWSGLCKGKVKPSGICGLGRPSSAVPVSFASSKRSTLLWTTFTSCRTSSSNMNSLSRVRCASKPTTVEEPQLNKDYSSKKVVLKSLPVSISSFSCSNEREKVQFKKE